MSSNLIPVVTIAWYGAFWNTNELILKHIEKDENKEPMLKVYNGSSIQNIYFAFKTTR